MKLLKSHPDREEDVWRTLTCNSPQYDSSKLSASTSTLRRLNGYLEHPARTKVDSPSLFSRFIHNIDFHTTSSQSIKDSCKAVDEATACWRDHDRSFSLTAKGLLVLGPSEAKVGDGVYIVGRALTPLILRNKSSGYRFVGDSYVHGLEDELKNGVELNVRLLNIT